MWRVDHQWAQLSKFLPFRHRNKEIRALFQPQLSKRLQLQMAAFDGWWLEGLKNKSVSCEQTRGNCCEGIRNRFVRVVF
ncbi:hypothetical protein CEXT_30131 [Caerostris extrusa]|uniref:Uncharacterized protein n=1 Tax=Caerostris extrusa TaxID=172846 RepID=A0AAV4M2C6_CAEEX|nr:hypothetical protein CEXT_30131 [Caerostris extrusa]